MESYYSHICIDLLCNFHNLIKFGFNFSDLPSYGGYTCSFDPNNNLIWISPIIKNAKENLYLQIKFCMSNYKNLYCRRDGSWQNTTCIQSEMSCSMRLKKNSKYVLQLLLSNGYGTTFNQSVLAFPERHCVGMLDVASYLLLAPHTSAKRGGKMMMMYRLS